MLTYLDILNGYLSPQFNEYNTLYSVNVNHEIENLELNYFYDEKYTVEIINNDNLIIGENEVIINVLENETIVMEYVLMVYREDAVTTFSQYDNSATLVQSNTMVKTPEYIVPLLFFGVLILLLIVYKILFPRKKTKKILVN